MPPARFSLLLLTAFVGAAAGTSSAPAQAPDRLQDQRVDGRYRICSYGRPEEAGRRGSRMLRVGRGEPCPGFYRRPRPPAPEEIPPFATLRERQVVQGRTICIYTYQNRNYNQVLPAGGYCTYTPVAPPS